MKNINVKKPTGRVTERLSSNLSFIKIYNVQGQLLRASLGQTLKGQTVVAMQALLSQGSCSISIGHRSMIRFCITGARLGSSSCIWASARSRSSRCAGDSSLHVANGDRRLRLHGNSLGPSVESSLFYRFCRQFWGTRLAAKAHRDDPILESGSEIRAYSDQPTPEGAEKLGPALPLEPLQPIVIRDEDIEESFVRGSGPGGQKINKTSSCVMLKHLPTGIVLRCQESRSQHRNRELARRILQTKIDHLVRGEHSRLAMEANKTRARKAVKRRKAVKKHFKSRRDQALFSD
jgi:RF-1 domain